MALAWVSAQPGITSPIVGASKPEQLQDHIAALDVVLSGEQRDALNEASRLGLAFPYGLFNADGRRVIFGGAQVKGWQ